MFIDNLTIAGVAAASLYALLPLFFGKETLRVSESADPVGESPARKPADGPRPAVHRGPRRPNPCS